MKNINNRGQMNINAIVIMAFIISFLYILTKLPIPSEYNKECLKNIAKINCKNNGFNDTTGTLNNENISYGGKSGSPFYPQTFLQFECIKYNQDNILDSNWTKLNFTTNELESCKPN